MNEIIINVYNDEVNVGVEEIIETVTIVITENAVVPSEAPIETASANGVPIPIVNKNIDIIIPTKTSDLTNNSDFVADANYVHTDNNYTDEAVLEVAKIVDKSNSSDVYTKSETYTQTEINNKLSAVYEFEGSALQPKLTSGVNIKTVGGQSILGSGDVSVVTTSASVSQEVGSSEVSVMSQKVTSVELDKVAIRSKNLFNKATVTEGFYILSNGSLAASATWGTSDFIPVEPNFNYSRTAAWPMAYYNSSKTFISYSTTGVTTLSPANAAFARVSYSPLAVKEYFQFEKSDVPTNFVPFGRPLSGASILPNTIEIAKHNSLADGSFFDSMQIGWGIASRDYSFDVVNPWSVGSGGSITWNLNNGEFTSGLNYVQITQAGIYQGISINIPDQYKVVGRKLRILFRYKLDKDVKIAAYFVNALGQIINNGTKPIKTLTNTVLEKIGFIDRPYEVGVDKVLLYFEENKTATFKIGSIQLKAESSFYQPDYEVFVAGITVAADGSGDFTSLRAALLNGNVVRNGTKSAPLNVFIKNGTYNEIDIKTGNYVNIVGESRDGVIIITDGSSTTLAPSNFMGGVAINTINKIDKHQWYINKTCTVKNLTSVFNDVKYSIHSDVGGIFDYTFENILFIKRDDLISGSGTNVKNYFMNTIGLGGWANQSHNYINCEFVNLTTTPNPTASAIFFHNIYNQSAKTNLKISKCLVNSQSLLNLNDLGSNQIDSVLLEDNVGDIQFTATGYYHGVTDINTPYSFDIRITNMIGKFIKYTDRPLIWADIKSQIVILAYNNLTSGLKYSRNTPYWVEDTNGDYLSVMVDSNYSYLIKV